MEYNYLCSGYSFLGIGFSLIFELLKPALSLRLDSHLSVHMLQLEHFSIGVYSHHMALEDCVTMLIFIERALN